MARGPGPRQDRLELTFTAEHRERQRAHHRWVLKEREGIAAADLGPGEKLTHDLLAYRSRDALQWLSHPFYQHYVFIHLHGRVGVNLVQLVGRQPFRNGADYRAWFRRLQRYPGYLEGIEAVLREGGAAQLTVPQVVAERALSQLESLAPQDVTQSSLWKPMTRFPAGMAAEAKDRLEADYRVLLSTEVLRAFHEALLEEGPLPLSMLKQRMHAWIIDAQERRALAEAGKRAQVLDHAAAQR